MKKSLLIHIGMNKAGSTAIQKFLTNNSESLKRFGWAYPNIYHELPDTVKKHNKDVGANARSIFYHGNPKVDIHSSHWDESIKIIKKNIEDYNVILSYEAISYYENMGMVIEEFKKVFRNVRIVYYIRRQDFYVESFWNQHIKGCLSYQCETRKTDVFFKEWNGWQSADYYAKIKELEDIVGKENIHVRIFEKEQFAGNRKDVVSDFLSVLNLPEEEFDLDLKSSERNERICNNYLELKRLVNSQWKPVTKGLYYIEDKLKEYTRESGFGKDYYIPSMQRKEILLRFADGNRKIAQEYFEREDGKLFYDEKIDFPCYQSPFEEKDEDIIKLFAAVMSRQDLLIEQLQNNMEHQSKKIQSMQEKLIKNLCGERKIVFFGAGVRGREAVEKINLPISFILDNSKDKQGQKLCDLEIKHPESIEKWDELFIIITVDKYLDIKEQLENIGLKEDKNFILYSELI